MSREVSRRSATSLARWSSGRWARRAREGALYLFLVVALHAAAPAPPHQFLTELCDDFGARLTGSAANAGAMDWLAERLRELGLKPEKMPFTMPGWQRGADRVELLAPVARPLRVAALSYTQPQPAFEAACVDIGNGRPEDYPKQEVSDCVGVLASGTPLQASEIVGAGAPPKMRGLCL
jgi:hypothetical protein